MARRVASALVTGFRAVHDGNMGKLMLGLAMAAVVLRSYIGLSPWKLALLLLSLFVLNLLQVRVRVGAVWRRACVALHWLVPPRSFDSAHVKLHPVLNCRHV